MALRNDDVVWSILVSMPVADPRTRNAYQREYQRENRSKLTAKKAERRQAQREFINGFKSKPCADCGGSFPACVMDFHHVRGAKKYEVSRLAKMSASWDTIRSEIAKCVLLCSNCHRIRHAKG